MHSPSISRTKYAGRFFVSLNILPKYSPTIPNSNICTPEKNSISKIFFNLRIRPNNLINALKVNIGLSLVGVISGEFLVSKAGLGYLIVYGGQVFKFDLVMTSVIILALMAWAMYKCVVLLEKGILKFIMHNSK